MSESSKAVQVYSLIDSKAGSNIAMQGLSGLFGFPFTLIADAGVVFTHYGPMLNSIRNIYGRSEITSKTITPIIKGCGSEILSDIVVDKVIGQLPVIGIPANMMCAKAMTWRLGLVFAMVSARGEEFTAESVKECCVLIRTLFPQKESFAFKKPSAVTVEKLLGAVGDCSQESFDQKINKILDSLE